MRVQPGYAALAAARLMDCADVRAAPDLGDAGDVAPTHWPQAAARRTRLRLSGSTSRPFRPGVEAMRASEEVMSLLDFPTHRTPDNGSVWKSWHDAGIDAVAIEALNAIIPPVSGKALPRPNRGPQKSEPKASDRQKISVGARRKAPRKRPAAKSAPAWKRSLSSEGVTAHGRPSRSWSPLLRRQHRLDADLLGQPRLQAENSGLVLMV